MMLPFKTSQGLPFCGRGAQFQSEAREDAHHLLIGILEIDKNSHEVYLSVNVAVARHVRCPLKIRGVFEFGGTMGPLDGCREYPTARSAQWVPFERGPPHALEALNVRCSPALQAPGRQ